MIRTDETWTPALPAPPLDSGSLHLWRSSLQIDDARYAGLREIVNEDERTRAARFHRDVDRRRYVGARARLRVLLAAYCDCRAADVRIDADGNGKPMMHPARSGGLVSFNVSHSGSVAVYAVAQAGDIGVDVECVERATDWQDVARRFFAAEEVDVLERLPPAAGVEAFLAAWTRKEAYAKACGLGLTLPFDRIRVTCGPDDEPRLIATPDGAADAARWSLRSFRPSGGCVGAVVMPGTGWKVEYFSLES